MRIGLCFDGFYSVQEMIELAKLADDIGMHSLWMSDHLCFRDSLTTAMALLGATRRIKVAAAPMSPYSRNPIITAMAIATMEEFAPGRVIASPGTGNAAALKEAGIESPHPLQTMREYVAILRGYLRGEAVRHHGKIFQVNGAKMGFTPGRMIDMYITAVRPRMLRLGGEIGDGVLLSGGCSPGYIARCVKEIEAGASTAGKTPGQCDVAGFVTAATSDDADEAVQANKLFLAYIFRNVHHAENIRLGAGSVDQEGLAAAVAKRDWESAQSFISDDVVHAHSIAGTPADCRKQLQQFVNGGLSLPILLPTGTQEGRRQVVQMARELVG